MAAASGGTPEEILDKIGEHCLSCSICLEQYKLPKLLPCHHTFCLHCLETLVKKKGILNCPTCQQEVDIPSGGVAALKNNFFMNTLLEVVEKRTEEAKKTQRKCEFCEEIDATYFCRDCEQYFCDGCLNLFHKKMKRASSHTVLSVEEHEKTKYDMQSTILSVERCKVHPHNEARFYCDTCQVPICSDCTIVDHRIPDHSHRYLQTVADECSKELSKMVDHLKAKAKDVDESKTIVVELCKKVKDQFEVEEGKVTQQKMIHTKVIETGIKELAICTKELESHIGRIEEEQSTLIEGLKTDCHLQIKQLETQIADLEFKYENIISTSGYVEALVNYGSAAQLVSSKATIVQRIEELVAMETKLGIKQEVVTFKSFSDVTTDGTMGVLRYDVCPHLCTVENIPKRLVKGESVKLLITTKDSRGKTVIPNQEVKVKVRKPDGSQEDIPVTDNKDGTHTVMIHGEIDGEYQVTMVIADHPIPGSPLVIHVIKGLVKTIGKEGSNAGDFNNPYGVTLNRHSDMVVADTLNCRIQIIDIHGKCKKVLTFTQFKNNFLPIDVAISADDEYFMADYGNNQIVVSDEDGNVVRCFGQNELKYPRGIYMSPLDGTVYVTDWDGELEDDSVKEGSHCIRKYRQNGDYINSFGKYGDKNGEFKGPYFMYIDSQGILYVTDCENCRVQVFRADEHFLYKFGIPGESDGQLYGPCGIVMDKDRYLYISDYKHRVQKFDMSGRLICRIDRDEDRLNNPQGLVLTNDVPAKLVVVDRDNHYLKVFVL
ncbi:E3 ubiquitin-protein ligase TRIM45-like [Glandiceps talaboti]